MNYKGKPPKYSSYYKDFKEVTLPEAKYKGKLTPALEEELKFLRSQLDRLTEDYVAVSSPQNNTKRRRARENLVIFVNKLRREGYSL